MIKGLSLTVILGVLLTAVLLAACQPAPGGEFAIYLLEQPLTARQADALELSQLSLRRQPLLTGADLLSYTRATHELALTEAASGRMAQLQIPVSGLPFVVCVGAERIYSGAFWTPVSSLSYDGITILFLPWNAPRALKIERGYPGEAFFARKDLRADQRVMDALASAGKLK